MNNSIPITSALDEETARAEVYGLLAALYYAPPTPELMAQLRVAVTEAPAAGGFLEEPWRDVVAAARELDDAAITTEYTCPIRERPRYAGVPTRAWLALARGLPDCTLLTKAFLWLWSYVTDTTLPAL